MIIKNIETFLIRIPFDTGGKKRELGGKSWQTLDYVFVRIDTDTGISGWGDAFGYGAAQATKAVLDHMIAPGLIGADISDIDAIHTQLQRENHLYGRYGVTMFAISGIDIAAWDIRGKAEGKTAAALMGMPQRDRVRAYVTTSRLGETDDSVRRRLDTCLETGVRALKVASDPHWGQEVDYACHVLALARAHVGKEIDLMFDAFGCFKSAEAALGVVPVLKENGYLWFEAPIPMDDRDGFAEIAGRGVAITGGDMGLTTRFEYEAMLVRGRADIAQPDATMVGGLSEMLQVAEMARGLGRRIIPHGYKSDILLATNLSFLAQHWDEEWLEYSIADSPLRWDMVHETFPVGPDGKVAVPQGPGLGLTLNDETVRRYREN